MTAETILIQLDGGPLDGGFEEIRRDDLCATDQGVVWRAKWRENVYAVYVFETPPEPACREGVIRNCWGGRHIGWETKRQPELPIDPPSDDRPTPVEIEQWRYQEADQRKDEEE